MICTQVGTIRWRRGIPQLDDWSFESWQAVVDYTAWPELMIIDGVAQWLRENGRSVEAGWLMEIRDEVAADRTKSGIAYCRSVTTFPDLLQTAK